MAASIHGGGYSAAPPHETTELIHPRWGMEFTSPGKEPVHIDRGIALLIAALWDAGIDTSSCCQEAFPGMAAIDFLRLSDMEECYTALASRREDDHIFHAWQWQLWADGGIRAALYFPCSHIEWATQTVKEYIIEQTVKEYINEVKITPVLLRPFDGG
jgi:hypothetical protein